MSGLNTDNVVVGESGHLWIADEDQAAPTASARFAPTTPWTELGYVTDDGATVTFGVTTQDITAWQASTAIRRLVTEEPVSIAFTLMQLDSDSLLLALRGGDFTQVDTAAVAQYAPPAAGAAPVKAFYLTWTDEATNYSIWFPRIQIAQEVALQAAKAQVVQLPINAEVLAATPNKFEFYSDRADLVTAGA